MRSKLWLLNIALLASDIILFIASFLLAYYIRILSGVFPAGFIPLNTYFNIIILSVVMLVIVFSYLKLYAEKRTLFNTEEFMNILYGLLFVFLILATITFLFKTSRYSRLIILFTFIISLLAITLGRVILRLIQAEFRKHGYNLRRTLLVGDKQLVSVMKKKIQESPELGYKVIGTIGAITPNLSKIIKRKRIDIVFLAKPRKNEELYELVFANPKTRFNIIPDVLEIVAEKINFLELKDIPISSIKEEKRFRLYPALKTIADVIIASLVVVILSPLWIILVILIKITSKGPVLFKQKRLGKNLNQFVFYKFRTMHPGADKIKLRLSKKNNADYLFKMKDDPRVTWFGKILRRTCLDEIPQLINIVKGEMSFVGPRPHLPTELHEFKGWKKKRFSVKPGLTGLWQVSGRHELNFDRTVSLDIYYIKNMSLILDLKIIIKTIPAILFSKGNW